MTIVINTMKELPEYCYDCPLNNPENGLCKADDCKRCSYEYRPYWCPLTVLEEKNDYKETKSL